MAAIRAGSAVAGFAVMVLLWPSESFGQAFRDAAGTNTTACRILRLDAEANPAKAATDQMWQVLHAVTVDADVAIRKLRPNPNGRWNRRHAEAVLRCIDTSLIDHGFVYPDVGGVDQLADSLRPFQMSRARRPFFELQPPNRRRESIIAERFPGPFYAVDCDTASFIYLEVADRLNLPLHMVLIPAHDQKPGHAFIRWREGSQYLDWETMNGEVTTDADYVKQWGIRSPEIKAGCALADLSADEVMGCEHYLLAVQYERLGEIETALRELSRARELAPRNLDVRRQFAWEAATVGQPGSPRSAEAIDSAMFVLSMVDDPDARDTLAAAYASAGNFDLAIKQERMAIAHGAHDRRAKFGYEKRLQLYEQHTPCLQVDPSRLTQGVLARPESGSTPQPGGAGHAPLPNQDQPEALP
jgi:tetratricopeptide (TPR) repeat protein